MAARATQTGPDSYDVKWDSGEEYKGVPYESARAAAPDSFSEVNEWAAQHAGGMNTEPVMPGAADPYIDANLEETVGGEFTGDQSDTSLIDDMMPAEQMPPVNPYAEQGIEPTIANQLAQARADAAGGPAYAGDQGDMSLIGDMMPPPPGSQSQSASYRGTGPYREAQRSGAPPRPDFAYEQALAQDAAKHKTAAAGMTGAGLMESRARRGGFVEDAAELNRQTIEKQNEMHEHAMAQVSEAEESLNNAMQNVSRMDMNKVWQDTSATAKFGGIMAAGIAGWLNPTGKNSVIEQMMEMVDQSARDQAANIATEKFAIAGQERALGRLGERLEDDEERYLAQRAMLLSNVTAQIEHEQKKYESIITLGNLDQIKAAAWDKLSETTQARSQNIYQNSARAWEVQEANKQKAADRRQRAAQFSMRRADAKAAAAAKADESGKQLPYVIEPHTRKKIYVDPMVWSHKSDGAKQAWTDKVSAHHKVADALKDLDNTVAHWGEVYGGLGKLSKLSPDADGYAEIEAARKRFIQTTAFAEGGKNLTGFEIEIFEKQMGPMDTWLSGVDSQVKLHRKLMHELRKENNRLYGEVGGKEITENKVADPYGPGQSEPAVTQSLTDFGGVEGQFDFPSRADVKEQSMQEALDVLKATTEAVGSATGPEDAASRAGHVKAAYDAYLSRYVEDPYSADAANERAGEVISVIESLPPEYRPTQDAAKDLQSFGEQSANVKLALEALQGEERSMRGQTNAFMKTKDKVSGEEFKQAIKLFGEQTHRGPK